MRPPPFRLLHVFSTFAPGGPQVRTCALIAGLGPEFDHAITALDGRVDAAQLLPEGAARLIEAPPKAGSPATVLRMRSLLVREQPDLVLTYNFGALDAALAARSLGLPLVHHEDGFRPDEVAGFKRRRVLLRRLALAGARRVVVISRTLERIALELWGLSPEKVAYVPNGIDAARYAPADRNLPLRRALAIPEPALVIGAVGHLRPEKNFARLLLAAGALRAERDTHALLLGDGPERAALEELALGPGLTGRVHFAGHVADPRGHYRAMDVFALSSDTEQMPIALLEAMASALPVAATDVGDVRAMLPEEQRRFVVAPGEGAVERLSGALDALANDSDLRRELGAANRREVERRFLLARMLERYRAIWLDALGVPEAHAERGHR
ncbi:MAG TPA: glycosyltransferase [Planctomycetota bacterium]|nr:glycosyltransferase [Planctomycetota bacterium]